VALDRVPTEARFRLERSFLGLAGGVTQAIEHLHTGLGVPTYWMLLRKVLNQLFDASSNLIREVGRRGSDKRVDIVDSRLSGIDHRAAL
jgi:hypothetical protein